jgi:hypothetical protein
VTNGHVYLVHTALTRPPKDKLTICICAAESLFFWINTEPRHHGIGQLPLEAGEHSALSHGCHLDCSRVTTFPPHELKAAQARGAISQKLATRIVGLLREAPPKTLPPRHLDLAIENLSALYPPTAEDRAN